MKEKVSNVLRRIALTFAILFVVFVFVIGSSCLLSSSSDFVGCLGLSFVYFFPWLWLVVFVSGLIFSRVRSFQSLAKKRFYQILLFSLLYVVVFDGLMLMKVETNNDLPFSGMIISVYLMTMSFFVMINRGL